MAGLRLCHPFFLPFPAQRVIKLIKYIQLIFITFVNIVKSNDIC